MDVDLEKERSKLESNYARAIDKIICSESIDPKLSEDEVRDIIVFYIAQAFITNDNISNNSEIAKKMLQLLCECFGISKKMIDNALLRMGMSENNFGIGNINSKFLDLLKGKGPYFDKAEILKDNFIPITLKQVNHKAFHTDKFFRNYSLFTANDIQWAFPYMNLSTTKMENLAFSLTEFTTGPLTRDKYILFINKEHLDKFGFSNKLAKFEIVENIYFEDYIYGEETKFMTLQVPVNYYYFHPEDTDWVLEYLNLKKNFENKT